MTLLYSIYDIIVLNQFSFSIFTFLLSSVGYVELKNTSRYGPFGPFVKCINNLETKYLGEKLARHNSLESLERPKCETIIPALKPRRKEVELSDHIQFLITEKSMPQASSSDDASRDPTDDGDILPDGRFLVFARIRLTLITPNNFTAAKRVPPID